MIAKISIFVYILCVSWHAKVGAGDETLDRPMIMDLIEMKAETNSTTQTSQLPDITEPTWPSTTTSTDPNNTNVGDGVGNEENNNSIVKRDSSLSINGNKKRFAVKKRQVGDMSFELADLAVRAAGPGGSTEILQGFPDKSNAEIIHGKVRDRYGELRWASIGIPALVAATGPP